MKMDRETEMAITIGQQLLMFKYLCDLLMEKGVITKAELEQITTTAQNDMKKILLEE